jgi:multidrug efflux pump subunit AcrB
VFSKFFIDRPIFASVLSIVITLGGGIALFTLPVAQYPDITPPTVEVSASYPGANADDVVKTVAAPIEQQVNGVEGMMYMSSQCTNDGTYTLTVTFKLGTDLNIAQVLVQNRVSLAQPILPPLVQRGGISVNKKSPSILMIVNLLSKIDPATGEPIRDQLYLSNYATIQLKDELKRLPGVGDISYLGQRDYSMRVWLNPARMAELNLSASDITNAIAAQNQQVAAGQIGQPPVPKGQTFQYTMTTLGRLANEEQFRNIIVRNDDDGRLIRLRDVADVELGAQSYDQTCTLDGKPSVAVSVYQLPGSNALEVSRLVKNKMEELKKRFPEGIDYSIVYDTTPFINESINEVFKTLRDAVILVAFVVLLFLQNWRSTLIPLVAVPVAVIGTFAVMAAMGFSLNNLTLFGLVLAIGIVVDDAIVVVEAVEHHIENGMSPRDATIRAMEQVSGPVVAVGLVLAAVFVPCAFISGITGQFFRQFALTIAVSTVISAFNSLTLSPALSALLLKPKAVRSYPIDGVTGNADDALPRPGFAIIFGWVGFAFLAPYLPALFGPAPAQWGALAAWAYPALGAILGAVFGWVLGRPLNHFLSGFFRAFNTGFNRTTNGYTRGVGLMLRGSVIVLLVYAGLLGLTWFSFTTTPTGFIPQQDKGYLLVNVQLPDAASLGRTENVMERIELVALGAKKMHERTGRAFTPEEQKKYPGIPGVNHTVSVAGQSILLNANSPNFGAMYVMLDDFHDRTGHDRSGDAIADRLQEAFEKETQGKAVVSIYGAPPVEGLGTAGGFKMVIQDRGDLGLDDLQKTTDAAVVKGSEQTGIAGLTTSFRANTPWLFLDVDRIQAKSRGVQIGELGAVLQVNIGSYYVNDFNKFGRTWRVIVQVKDTYRHDVRDLKQIQVPNSQGDMVPISGLAKVTGVNGPVMIGRYNMYPATTINGSAAAGTSSGQALDLMQDSVGPVLPPSMNYEWTELALLQLQTGNTAMLVFLLAVVLVFLVLAAQYESWSLPLAVILVVPMCLLCSIAGVLMARMDVNIFTQVGFVVLVGLACKNAILIVEFAKARREAGVPRYEATLAACKLRLRPIIMTSFAFILGVVPLVISEGAGSEMRRTLGTAVFAGMLGVTLFGIFLTPVFYYVIQWVIDLRYGEKGTAAVEANGNGLGGGH